MSFRSGDGSGLDSEEVLLREPGYHTIANPPLAWTNAFVGPNRPVYTKAAILYASRPGCTTPTQPIDIDAMSGGFDVINAFPDGSVNQTGSRWGSLFFSVDAGFQGQSNGNGQTIATEAGGAGGATADVFSYVLRGASVPVPPDFVGVTMRSQDAFESGLPQGGVDSDIDALDANVPATRLDGLVAAGLPGGNRNFYFSVSNATLANVPSDWWNGETPSGATILRSRWIPSLQAWTCPRPFLTFCQLGLQQTDDLTAVAVDEAQCFALYSSTSPTVNPLMFIDFCPMPTCSGPAPEGAPESTTPTPFHYDTALGDEPVSEDIGLLDGDVVDAICSLDPGLLDNGVPVVDSYRYGALRGPQFAGLFPYALNTSAFRWVNGVQPVIKAYVAGWPPSGTGGSAILTVNTGGSATLPHPVNGFGGGPVELTANLPVTPVASSVLLTWFVARPPFNILGTPQDVDVSNPVQFFLP